MACWGRGKHTVHAAFSMRQRWVRRQHGLDLGITVRLLDKPSKRTVEDDDGVLDALLQSWIRAGHPLPDGHELEDLHWGVKSAIPKKQGLKSSAATCIAALRALGNATNVHPSNHELVAMAAGTNGLAFH